MFKTIQNALKTPEIRNRLLYTLLLIVLFRLGCFITVPGINTLNLEALTHGMSTGIGSLIDIISRRGFF